jgi:alpha-tubulin suppressor-like RCC1 family protein
MALTSAGALYLWGRNTYGQIGDASTTDRTTPVQSNLTNVVGIAAGGDFSIALNSSGQVFVWGRDNKGQLGDGSSGTNDKTTAPGSALTSSVAAVAAGKEFTLVVKTDGTVFGTGENANYQLGDGTATNRSSLVQMSGITTATAAVAGEKFSVVRLSSGNLKAIGYNSYGQLGTYPTRNGRPSSVSRPFPISGAGEWSESRCRARERWHRLDLGPQHLRPAR